MLGALLAFNDAQLEREFWQSPPVRNRLLAIDQFITAIVIFNNVIAVLHALEWGSAQQNAGPPTFFFSFLLGGVIYVAMQAAVCWACSRHTDAYYRVRNAVMIVLRLVRILPLFCLSIVSSGPIEDAFAGFLVQRSGSNPVWAISRLILTRSFIVWGFLYQAQFMLPFRLNLLLHCAFAPVLLHAASRLAFTFDHPQLKPTVCRLATRLIILSGARPGGNCPRLAAPVVSYSVNICIGYVMPLFVAYIVEYRKKIDFMRHHWRTRHEFAASSLAPGGLLAYEHGVRYIVTCCLLLLNVLMLINVAVVAVVTHMNATLSE